MRPRLVKQLLAVKRKSPRVDRGLKPIVGDVFERFTDRARRVLFLAQGEARHLQHNSIGTEHILLGLINEGEAVAAKAMESIGITLDAARTRVAEMVGPVSGGHRDSPPFTPRAKRLLECSLREAKDLGHSYIGTEHLLLGLLRDDESFGVRVLVSMGADAKTVRERVMQLLDEHRSERRP